MVDYVMLSLFTDFVVSQPKHDCIIFIFFNIPVSVKLLGDIHNQADIDKL